MVKNLNSKLILGTVQFGLDYGINNTNGQVSLESSHQILQHAFNQGIQILDTAEAYGNAHSVIGTFHEKNPDKIFEIITKLPHQFNSNISDKVISYLNDLKVTKLHALLFHSFLSYKENINYFDALIQLKKADKIKYVGVSVYTNKEIEDVLLNDDVDIIQLPFNLFDNICQRGTILEKAKSKGKIIHTRSAFLQGLFFKDINSKNKIAQNLKEELLEILKISNKNQISTAQLALNYCLQQTLIDNVLIGVDSLKQLEQNIESVKHSIDAALIDQINKIKVEDVQLLNPSLWN
ncbi:aldo/keto reductase [Polaribacter litorisediminis]|uniref:aldo/keto reductase n=1 Tax=Polaribacter litorisediminis TaxID=1908341 RepID=UPI001CBEF47D|nr:aldo/keto reductase [Polaribacter litorisediminis]UAM97209.1 aldo/keto reductase [Polaribacter litorisediminis]